MKLENCQGEQAVLVHCDSEQDLTKRVNTWIESNQSKDSDLKIYLPAGESPIPIYKEWEKTSPQFLTRLKLIQIDDVCSGPKAFMFKDFFKAQLPSFQNQFHWIESESVQADIALLGLGTNGHVAFHEPGLPQDFHFGKVTLADETCKRLGLDANTQGLSYGLGAFMKTKSIRMILRGSSKDQTLKQVLEGNPSFPAAQLLKHPDFKIFKSN